MFLKKKESHLLFIDDKEQFKVFDNSNMDYIPKVNHHYSTLELSLKYDYAFKCKSCMKNECFG